MADLSPVVDITSLNAVESLFRGGTRDPWGPRLAGRLADFFVYSDVARFTMPVWARVVSPDYPTLPPILAQFRSRDSQLFAPLIYQIEERRTLHPEYLGEAFRGFARWARNSKDALRRWLQLHAEPWIRDGHLARIRPRYVFDVERLHEDPLLEELAAVVGMSVDDILYAFDVVLRYPLYGELVGTDSYFLAHPIRELQALPTMSKETGPAPNIALSLADAVAGMAPSMTLEAYATFLHEARGVIRDRNIHELKAGSLDREATREVAALLGLPARLSAAGKIMGVTAGLIGLAGAAPALAPAAAIGGSLVSVASALWTGTVGRRPSRSSWLRWALEWDVERQASDA
jgi:hypothetical protein